MFKQLHLYPELNRECNCGKHTVSAGLIGLSGVEIFSVSLDPVGIQVYAAYILMEIYFK